MDLIQMCVDLIYEMGFYNYGTHVQTLGMFLEMALILTVLAVPFIVVIGIIKYIARLGRYEY